jgi:hypothetical protein
VTALRDHVGLFTRGLVHGAGLMLGILGGIYLWHVLGLPVGWVFQVQR